MVQWVFRLHLRGFRQSQREGLSRAGNRPGLPEKKWKLNQLQVCWVTFEVHGCWFSIYDPVSRPLQLFAIRCETLEYLNRDRETQRIRPALSRKREHQKKCKPIFKHLSIRNRSESVRQFDRWDALIGSPGCTVVSCRSSISAFGLPVRNENLQMLIAF